VSFYKRKEVKDTISYLRAVVNPRDDESLLRIVNEPPRGLGKTSIDHLQQFAEARNLSLLEAFQQAEQVEALQKRAQTAAHGFATILQRAASHQSAARADEVAKMLMESSGLLKMYEDDGSEEALDRWNNIQRVLSHLAEYCERRAADGESATLEQYLQEIALIADIDVMKAGGKHVTLMTIHSSKGLEFPVVFIAGMERGLFPGTRAEQQQDEMEEERRLFYVGITRAEEQLYLTHTEKRYRFGELTYPLPSPFLGEIRAELLEHGGTSIQSRFSSGTNVGAASQGRTYQSSGHSSSQSQTRGMTYWQKPAEAAPKRDFDDIPHEENYSQASPDDSFDDIPLRVGSRVRHQMFGDGKVAKLTGAGETAQVEVDFASVGRKKLVLKFAKLTVLS